MHRVNTRAPCGLASHFPRLQTLLCLRCSAVLSVCCQPEMLRYRPNCQECLRCVSNSGRLMTLCLSSISCWYGASSPGRAEPLTSATNGTTSCNRAALTYLGTLNTLPAPSGECSLSICDLANHAAVQWSCVNAMALYGMMFSCMYFVRTLKEKVR